jgi:hypothetical protein
MICSVTGIRLAAGTYTIVDDQKFHTTFLTKWNEKHAIPFKDADASAKLAFIKDELTNVITYCTEQEEIDLGYVKVLVAGLIAEDGTEAAITIVDLYNSIRSICMTASYIPNEDDSVQNYMDVADFLYFCFTVFLQDDYDSFVGSINLYGRSTPAAGLLAAILST